MGQSGLESHFRQQLGALGAPFPVGRAQLVESHGGIHARGAGAGHRVVESKLYDSGRLCPGCGMVYKCHG